MDQRRCLVAFAAIILCALSATAQAALVGYWQFEGNANDSSGLGNHGTLQNGAGFFADDPQGPGQSLNLAGGSQHVLVPHNSSLNMPTQMTIAAWVRPIGNVAWDGVIAKSPSNGSGNQHAGNYELRIENGSRVPTFLYQQGGVNDTAAVNGAPGTVTDNVWTHVAVTVKEGSFASFYLNGAQVASPTVSAAFGALNTNPLYIGTRADLFTPMNGRIDDVALFNHALSASEISTIMGGNLSAYRQGQLVSGVNATASSELVGAPFNRAAQFAANGAGFVPATGTHTVTPDGAMWLNRGSSGAFGTPDTNPFITFDLGMKRDITEVQIWNYNEFLTGRADLLARGVNRATFQVSDDGINFVDIFTTNITQAPGVANLDFHDTFQVNAVGRYLRLANLTNHGGDNGFVGLSEVRIFAIPIPEPATASLALLALGGLMLRRRRMA